MSYKTHLKKTLCKCPRCEKMHKMMMFWTGKNTPRKYCHNCELIMGRLAGPQFTEEHSVLIPEKG